MIFKWLRTIVCNCPLIRLVCSVIWVTTGKRKNVATVEWPVIETAGVCLQNYECLICNPYQSCSDSSNNLTASFRLQITHTYTTVETSHHKSYAVARGKEKGVEVVLTQQLLLNSSKGIWTSLIALYFLFTLYATRQLHLPNCHLYAFTGNSYIQHRWYLNGSKPEFEGSLYLTSPSWLKASKYCKICNCLLPV